MQIENAYEIGLWVPSYYGNKFTVARKTPKFSSSNDQDLTFRVNSLTEAQAECNRRNLQAA